MLSQHLERENRTQTSRKRILSSTKPMNFDDSQPVWIKSWIVKEKAPLNDDDDSVGTSGSCRNYNLPRSENRNDRGSNGWGWLFGYAVMSDTADELPPPPPKEVNKYRSPGSYGRTSTSNSPFGQVKLRKTGLQTEPSASRSPREKVHQPKSVYINDSWNTKYNGLTIELNAKEAAANVLQANISTDKDGPPKNLIELTHLHEPSLIQSLRERYSEENVYTFCGKILLALNPFQEIKGLYTDEAMKKYWTLGDGHDDGSLQPHVYAIAHEAFTSMKRAFDDATDYSGRKGKKGSDDNVIIDQSILVSGESGAGKTVTTKIVMQYLAKLSEKAASNNGNNRTISNSGTSSMEQQVLQSNPVLESFGNARTVRNDNSSRFGKFIEIQFDRSGMLMGATIKTYLLEKIRLIRQAEGERNYHIFYELLSGMKARDSDRKELGLSGYGVHDFRITASSGTFDRRDGVKDTKTFSDLKDAMDTVGFTNDERKGIFKVISGLLHLSNVEFRETNADTVILNRSRSLDVVLELFGVDSDALADALCTCTITVGQEVVKKNLCLNNVEKAVEALMKATYGALFEYIVRRVNSSITVGNDSLGCGVDSAFIKILDIFGFESFETNSFEQLCINYCNESLQQQFNKHIFKLEQQEYEKEGIAWSFIAFPDNQDILDLIEKKHSGIFSILDECCRLAKCTDQSFANATYEKCIESPRFDANRTQKARGLFSIEHYAGTVEYDCQSFLDKNKDELPKEATDFLLSSSASIFAELGKILSNKISGGTKMKTSSHRASSSSLARASVGSQFASQLRILRENIDKTSPHYIRCLKPNDELVPDNFVPAIIADQLRCAGVLEAVRVSRIGYPQRYSKDMFVQRYWILGIIALNRARRSRGCDLCEALVEFIVPQLWQRQNCKSGGENIIQHRAAFDLVEVGIQLGKTKVFLRHQAFEALEFLRGRKLYSSATCIQSGARMRFERRKYLQALSCILKIQCCVRRYQATRKVRTLRENKSAVVIQTSWRGFEAYSRFTILLFIASWGQRVHRGNVARKHFQVIRRNHKATVIQSWWRMIKERNYFLVQQYLAFNLQQLFRMKAARKELKKLKLEAKDFSRVANERDELRRKTEEMRAQLKEANRKAEEAAKRHAVIEAESSSSKTRIMNANEEKKFSEDHSDELERWRLRYEEKNIECKAKDKEISRLQNLVEAMKTEINEMKNQAESQYIPFSFKKARSVVSEAVSPSQHVLNSSFQSLKWANSTCRTEQTDLDQSSYEDVSTSFRPGYFDNPIHSAIRAADDDALSVAMTNCEDVVSEVNQGGRDGKTPLHLAISGMNLASAEFLLRNDSVVANAQDNDGNTPLHYAKNVSFVKLLLDVGGANPNIPNERGFCAIHVAVQRRDVDSVECLISHSANINVADDSKWLTPMHLVAQDTINDANARTKKLREGGQHVSPVIQIAKLLCGTTTANPPDMNYQDRNGNTPLHHASILQQSDAGELMLLFLNNGANPNIKNGRGQTPMHLFMHNVGLRRFDFFTDVVQLMLYQGCDTNIQSQNGCAPIHLAIYHGDIENALVLLERGAQLHLSWQKPARWEKYWKDNGSGNEVFCLDMVEDDVAMRRILNSISTPQELAPVRSNCMQCKRKVIGFGKNHCHHCGSFVCRRCSENKLDPSYFPPYCSHLIKNSEAVRVCNLCEDILVTRKQDQQAIMGREVYFHPRQEDVSMLDSLDMETSFQACRQPTNV